MDLRRAARALCGATAAAALFAIMVLTLVDVSGRKLLSASVPGSLELTELLMVVVIFASLPLVALGGEHVVFDSLDSRLPRWLRRPQRMVVELFCGTGMAGLGVLMWIKAGDMTGYGDTTSQLKLPLGAFVYLMSALIFAAALAHLVVAVARPPVPNPASRNKDPDDMAEEGGLL
jgi:TRAP-type C4-dicarboxylate transport system permease small subunit